MNKSAQPLLSYLLLTYNQERYVREAVESAFAQNYSPLEIIISDDHSTDNTWEIIKELFNKYNGPHKVIINRNKQNLGIANHVNKVMSMAKGELFIMAAGDDIACINKTTEFYREWIKSPNHIMALCSSYYEIDNSNKMLNLKQPNSIIGIDTRNKYSIIKENEWFGCSAAYNPLMFDIVGNLYLDTEEDKPLFRKAVIVGKISRIKKPLTYYRITSGISSYNDCNMLKIISHKKKLLNGIKNSIRDINKIIKGNSFIYDKQLITALYFLYYLYLKSLAICFIVKLCYFTNINPYKYKKFIKEKLSKTFLNFIRK